jgi:hypothetical protein
MQRVCHPSAATALPTPAPAGAPGYFGRGNPLNGGPATVVTADFLNGVAEEMIGVIESAGLDPDINDNTQLLQATLTLGVRTNRVLNGQMHTWLVSSIAAGATGVNYGPAQWRVSSVGTTYSVARGTFEEGHSSVPGSPRYYLTVATNSVTGGGNYCRISQPIEDVRVYSGRSVAVSFWARAEVSGTPVAVAFEQYFGSSGSASVSGIGRTKLTLTDTWQRYQVIADINSDAGKTIVASYGTCLDMQIWIDAGSDYSAVTDAIGQGSRTVHITNATMVIGRVAIDTDSKTDRTESLDLARYYSTAGAAAVSAPSGSGLWCAQTVPAGSLQYFPAVRFRPVMRVPPTVTIVNPAASGAQAYNVTRNAPCSGTVIDLISRDGFVASATTPAGSAAGDLIGFHWTADARF